MTEEPRSDTKAALRLAYTSLPGSARDFDALDRRRRRAVIRRRMGGAIVGTAVAVALVAGLLAVDDGDPGVTHRPAEGVSYGLADGERYEREVHVFQLAPAGRTEPDGSCEPTHCPMVMHQREVSRSDGSSATTEGATRTEFFDPVEREEYEAEVGAAVWHEVEGGRAFDVPFAGWTDADPVALERWLARGNALDGASPAPPSPDATQRWHAVFWDVLSGLGRYAPPAARASAVALLEDIPGVRVERDAVDPLGRSAIAFSRLDAAFDGGAEAQEWIYADPRSLVPMALVAHFSGDPAYSYAELITRDAIVGADGIDRTFVRTVSDPGTPLEDPRET